MWSHLDMIALNKNNFTQQELIEQGDGHWRIIYNDYFHKILTVVIDWINEEFMSELYY